MMTFEEALEIKKIYTEINDRHSKILKSFVDLGEDEIFKGIPNEKIRNSIEYKKATENFRKSFKNLQDFNKFFIKNFKKEYLAERKKNRGY